MSNDLYRRVADLGADELVELRPDERPELPAGCLLDNFGIVLTHIGRGRTQVDMLVEEQHLNQRGIVQAGAVVALADAAAGWAARTAIEHGWFTTLELRCSLLQAARPGQSLTAVTSPVHLGRRTLVLEVDVYLTGDPARRIARFGCTQLVLDPPADSAPNRDQP